MTTLADLKPDQWTAVARNVRDRDGNYVWEWALSTYDHAALNLAHDAGRVIKIHKRGADGIMRIWAILAPLNRKAPVVAFDNLGKGLFEQ